MTRDEKLDTILRQQTLILDLLASLKRDVDKAPRVRTEPTAAPTNVLDAQARAQRARLTETDEQRDQRRTELEQLADLEPIPEQAATIGDARTRLTLVEGDTA